MNQRTWICCQLGAREHYAIPRALASRGLLRALITDVWMPPRSRLVPGFLSRGKLRQRYHPALQGACVYSFNSEFLGFELVHRLRQTENWTRMLARNRLFSRCAIHGLKRMRGDLPTTLFAYSYASLDLFRWAKKQGWRTVLGQIDPGPAEMEIVRKEMEDVAEKDTCRTPPDEYWENWREECALADTIVVNSRWSRDLLQQSGIPTEKMRIIPLAYEPPDVLAAPKEYPAHFTGQKPLRVLFLGQICLRKGVARLLQAAESLRKEPIEFWMVGPKQIDSSVGGQDETAVRWLGAVSRAGAVRYYRNADIFILPTLSDGFALTQLEALAHRLPVIASAHCGDVVRDGVDGRILPAPKVEWIVAALRECLHAPALLAAWSAAAALRPEFSLAALASRLAELT